MDGEVDPGAGGRADRPGHKVSADTVGDLLRAEGFSLQGNAKTIEGTQHPDRDAQFRYISEQARACQEAGDPVISVDTKKKELVGDFANGGKEYRPKGSPVPVRTHDFMDKDLGKAIPYGVYDLAANAGWVNVGTDHDTAAFAVESIRRWWKAMGQAAYPHARRLLITADAGGSNSYRTRAWKAELAAFALETGLAVTVCHFPPGTSKWNKIEHRLFSHITMNWRGRPLTSHEVIVNIIAATTTRTGLTVTELRGMLMMKRAQLERSLREEEARLRHIELRIAQIDLDGAISGYDVVLKSAVAQPFLALHCLCENMDEAVQAVRSVAEAGTRQIKPTVRDKLVVVAHNNRDDEKVALDIGFTLTRPTNASVRTTNGALLEISELPAADAMATIVRAGTNTESHAPFGAIGAWIEANKYQLDGPCREVFLEPITGPPGFESALVEIQFPVRLTA